MSERKPSKTLIHPEDPRGPALKKIYRRLAQTEVAKHQEAVAKTREEALATRTSENVDVQGKIENATLQIHELEQTLVQKTLSASLQKMAQSTLDGLKSQREILRLELERRVQEPVADDGFVKFDDKEHEKVRGNIEVKMERFIQNEHILEQTIDGLRGPQESGWAHSALSGFVPFLEKTYLGEGAVTRSVLRQYSEEMLKKTSEKHVLSEGLTMEARRGVDELVRQAMQKQLKELETVPQSIRSAMEAEIRKVFFHVTEDQKQELLKEYLENPSQTLSVSLKSPDAAIVALRSAVLEKGILKSEEVRFLLATFLVGDLHVRGSMSRGNMSVRLTDEDRAFLVRHRSSGKRPAEEDFEQWKKIFPDQLVNFGSMPRELLLMEEKLKNDGERFAFINELEGQWEKMKGKDWKSEVAQRYEQAVETDLRDLASAVGEETRALDGVGREVTSALRYLKDFNGEENDLSKFLSSSSIRFTNWDTFGLWLQPLNRKLIEGSFKLTVSPNTVIQRLRDVLSRPSDGGYSRSGRMGLQAFVSRAVSGVDIGRDFSHYYDDARAIVGGDRFLDVAQRKQRSGFRDAPSAIESSVFDERLKTLSARIEKEMTPSATIQTSLREGLEKAREQIAGKRKEAEGVLLAQVAQIETVFAEILEEKKKRLRKIEAIQNVIRADVTAQKPEVEEKIAQLSAEVPVGATEDSLRKATKDAYELRESLEGKTWIWDKAGKIATAEQARQTASDQLEVLHQLNKAKQQLEMLENMEKFELKA